MTRIGKVIMPQLHSAFEYVTTVHLYGKIYQKEGCASNEKSTILVQIYFRYRYDNRDICIPYRDFFLSTLNIARLARSLYLLVYQRFNQALKKGLMLIFTKTLCLEGFLAFTSVRLDFFPTICYFGLLWLANSKN